MSSLITVLHRCDPKDTPVTLNVNGKVATIPNNTETAIAALFRDAALNCGFPIEILGEADAATEEPDALLPVGGGNPVQPAAGGVSADAGDGGTGPGVATFNADAIIEGTIPDVAARLNGLTADELAAVQKAELDREQPRAGVKAAIEAALKAKENPSV